MGKECDMLAFLLMTVVKRTFGDDYGCGYGYNTLASSLMARRRAFDDG